MLRAISSIFALPATTYRQDDPFVALAKRRRAEAQCPAALIHPAMQKSAPTAAKTESGIHRSFTNASRGLSRLT
jgi:hypothetical protein